MKIDIECSFEQNKKLIFVDTACGIEKENKQEMINAVTKLETKAHQMGYRVRKTKHSDGFLNLKYVLSKNDC